MLRLILINLVVLFLSSCASVTSLSPEPSPTPNLSWEKRTSSLSRLNNWQISGKVAVQTQRDAGSASVEWQQQNNQYMISLAGPLGSASMKLTGTPNGVTLDTSDGKHQTAHNAEQLLADNWGFNLPVSNLRYWVRGLPVPNLPSTPQFDTSHRLASLSQAGWQIQFQGYSTTNGIELPQRITATNGAMKVKMVIYSWKF